MAVVTQLPRTTPSIVLPPSGYPQEDPGRQQMQGTKTELKTVKKRERNRVAASKIRQKHTQRADTLHQEFEELEKDNAALRKEIQKLQQEQTYWTKVLQQHEDTCILLSPDIMLELLKPQPLFSPSDTEQFTEC